MKASITIEDLPTGGVHLSIEYSEPVSDDTVSDAVQASLIMLDSLKDNIKEVL